MPSQNRRRKLSVLVVLAVLCSFGLRRASRTIETQAFSVLFHRSRPGANWKPGSSNTRPQPLYPANGVQHSRLAPLRIIIAAFGFICAAGLRIDGGLCNARRLVGFRRNEGKIRARVCVASKTVASGVKPPPKFSFSQGETSTSFPTEFEHEVGFEATATIVHVLPFPHVFDAALPFRALSALAESPSVRSLDEEETLILANQISFSSCLPAANSCQAGASTSNSAGPEVSDPSAVDAILSSFDLRFRTTAAPAQESAQIEADLVDSSASSRTRALPAVRVGRDRKPTFRNKFRFRARGSASARTKSKERRKVGARLLTRPPLVQQGTPAFDPSRVRLKLQFGVRSKSQLSSAAARELETSGQPQTRLDAVVAVVEEEE